MRPGRLPVLGLCALTAISFGAAAQGAGDRAGDPSAATSAPDAPAAQVEHSQVERNHVDQLRDLRGDLGATDARRRALEAEVEASRRDRGKLKQSLIDTTRRIETTSAKADETQNRLDTLTGAEDAIRRSLDARRAVLGEVLAALQRMGRAAPPAILVRPDDLLAAVHASILLGALLPDMRAEAEALAGDLRQLSRVRDSIAAERDTLKRDLEALEGERTRLSLLTAARQKAEGETEDALARQKRRAEDLARQASTLEALIARTESEDGEARRGGDAEERRRKQAALEAEAQQARIAASPFKDAARLAPSIPFAEARGKLPPPVSGPVVRAFGVPDGFGATEKGLSIGARPGAPVASPADGWIVFAGPYRSYGQLVIVNAGGGFNIVLAGMERSSVAVGQFVLAGEPVGIMGAGAARAAAAIAIGAAQPILYVEFRKDGSAIDPSPWWAQPDMQRVRG